MAETASGFVWTFRESVRRNKGDVCVPIGAAPKFAQRFTVIFPGSGEVPDCYIDGRSRLRGKGFGSALVAWADKEGLVDGDRVNVAVDQGGTVCTFTSLKGS